MPRMPQEKNLLALLRLFAEGLVTWFKVLLAVTAAIIVLIVIVGIAIF